MNKVEKISPARSFAHKLWTIGANDPKKAIHALKVGLALSLVSLFYYVRPLYDGVAGSAIAAILTVAVVFEYHAALVASFARFVPVVKARYDYGMLVFIVTFTLISLSGHRMEKVLDLAKYRSYTVALGSFICVLVSMLIRPAWAGKELHKLVVGNTEKLANSLEGDDAKCKDSLQKIYGYKSILTSKALEERLANLARWEPPHGPYGSQHPWKSYIKIGDAMRYCASCMETLHSFTKSRIKLQAKTLFQHQEVVVKPQQVLLIS
ncbi:hypothetical protein HPP92_007149 [Vanilla planifolia]|uniref:Aluminum-activated malate transporter n=1 Tax=Vanilla planifolia TaxID=51239 RepID=A0A835RDB0_VANPL|nr:hypothetical protein HPP92_007149 [Vanilla planifolia]